MVSLTLYRFAQAPAGQVTVPNVTNQPAANARNILRTRGLNSRVVGHINTPNRGLSGRVASQSPRANARVRRGSVVSLRLYRFGQAPAGQVTVPNVSNQSLMSALNRLSGAGLWPQKVSFVPTRNAGLNLRVQNQSPRADARIGRGGPVNLHVFWHTP